MHGAVGYFLREHVFPLCLVHRSQKLSATGEARAAPFHSRKHEKNRMYLAPPGGWGLLTLGFPFR